MATLIPLGVAGSLVLLAGLIDTRPDTITFNESTPAVTTAPAPYRTPLPGWTLCRTGDSKYGWNCLHPASTHEISQPSR